MWIITKVSINVIKEKIARMTYDISKASKSSSHTNYKIIYMGDFIQRLLNGIKNDVKADIEAVKAHQSNYQQSNPEFDGYVHCNLTFRGKHQSMEQVYKVLRDLQKEQKSKDGAGIVIPIYLPPTYFGHFYNLDVPDYDEGEIPEMITYKCQVNPNYDMINSFCSYYPDLEFALIYVADDLSKCGFIYSERENRKSNNVTDFTNVTEIDGDTIQAVMDSKPSAFKNLGNFAKGYKIVDAKVNIETRLRKLY